MIIAPHVIIGAAIGVKTQNLGLIIILGIVVHFIVDTIPHWDYRVPAVLNFQKEKNPKGLAKDFIKLTIDGLIGLLIVSAVIWQKNLFGPNSLYFIFWGIFFSVLPDVISGLIFLFGKNLIFKKYIKFHDDFLHGIYKKQREGKFTFPGLLTQVLVIVITVLFFFS